MLIHLIKTVEQKLTNPCLAASDSVVQIQDLNLQDNKTAYYIKTRWMGAEVRQVPRNIYEVKI